MRFTVSGVLHDGGPFVVNVDDLDPPDAAWGVASGSSAAMGLLRGLDGRTVKATPAGPVYTLSSTDPASILAALHQHATVTAIDGDAPAVAGTETAGAIA